MSNLWTNFALTTLKWLLSSGEISETIKYPHCNEITNLREATNARFCWKMHQPNLYRECCSINLIRVMTLS